MIASKLHIYVFATTTLGFALGLLPGLDGIDLLVHLTPSGSGLATKQDGATAVGFNLALLLTVIAVISHAISSDDIEDVAIFEWYGCLIFGGALAVSMFGLATFVWSEGFPSITYGRGARALYQLSSRHVLVLYCTCLGLFLLGGFGLYLLAKVPQLLKLRLN
ncbi:hypothetical protein ID144_19440 [Pseudomonas sp. JM0905a]|uniref:hypothetical protein n=1 Tax=Pseudomonas sp. JM0905a TaxID=2772484 RepID=UPI001682CE6F|nr:hypothetical protein [Pseudomonas sp. JM0905a]MBD2839214.1 hypothetical protein [Pseudomonas sp. JM0905a]